MKKVIMLAAVVAALASCQSKANKAAEAEADSIAIEAMSPTVEATEVYEGTLPAADGPGIRYVLTLNMLADANDTTYTLDMTGRRPWSPLRRPYSIRLEKSWEKNRELKNSSEESCAEMQQK